MLVKDGQVSNSVYSLEHCCNVDCASLFYRYYYRFCWSEVSGLNHEKHVSLRNTLVSWQAYPGVVAWLEDRTIPTDKIRSLVGLFVGGIPFLQKL